MLSHFSRVLLLRVCLQRGKPGFNAWIGKIPWRKKWQPTPVLLPGKSHGWRSLVGYSPWGRKKSDTTERLHFHTLEKEMATHSSTLVWKIAWMEEPGGLQSMGSLRVGHDWATSLSLFHFLALEKEMATHSSILACKIAWMEEPGGLQSMVSQRVWQDWATSVIHKTRVIWVAI